MGMKAQKKGRLGGLFLSREEAAAVSHARRPDLVKAEVKPSSRYFLAVNLHRCRKQRGWSQAELARRANLSLRTVQGIESVTEETAPNLDTVDQLSFALNVTFSKLVERRKEVKVSV